MRIKSKFHDYYDTALAHGQDDGVVYVRETRVVGKPHLGSEDYDAHKNAWDEATREITLKLPGLGVREEVPGGRSADPGAVYFCGKLYPFYVLARESADTESNEVDLMFSWERGFDALVAQRDWTRRQEGDWQEALAREAGRDVTAVNLRHRSPIVLHLPERPYARPYHKGRYWSFEPERLVMDPCLKDLGFHKVLDPYTAFQEIAMFVGGVLAQQMDPPSPMTDKEKVASHGLDPVYGFRKPPKG